MRRGTVFRPAQCVSLMALMIQCASHTLGNNTRPVFLFLSSRGLPLDRERTFEYSRLHCFRPVGQSAGRAVERAWMLYRLRFLNRSLYNLLILNVTLCRAFLASEGDFIQFSCLCVKHRNLRPAGCNFCADCVLPEH